MIKHLAPFSLIAIAFLFSGCGGTASNNLNGYSNSYNTKESRNIAYTQLQAIERTKKRFKKRKLLGFEESKIFDYLSSFIDEHDSSLILLAQVSLGEIISHPELYRAINSKRVDFCIVDKKFTPIMVVEYSGSGHYGNNYDLRDKIKEEACKSAGIDFVTITYRENLYEAVTNKILPLLQEKHRF